MYKEQSHRFSWRARWKSIGYAIEGIHSFFRTQHNAVIHLYMTILVFGAAIFFATTMGEMIALILAAGFVWAAEIFNTAIELAMDHFAPAKHRRIKRIKDMSAAAVLVSAVTAVVTGLIIFIPKIIM
jgi:diacylglycerol kinase